jgi:hypothetical protein
MADDKNGNADLYSLQRQIWLWSASDSFSGILPGAGTYYKWQLLDTCIIRHALKCDGLASTGSRLSDGQRGLVVGRSEI